VQQGILNPDMRNDVRRQAAFQADQEIRNGRGRLADAPDDQVGWNFRKSWRTAKFNERQVIGSDYDYYNIVLGQIISMYKGATGVRDPDPTGNLLFGPTAGSYRDSYGIWENGKQVSKGKKLEGPIVDFGPIVDYGLFMEKWNTHGAKRSVNPGASYNFNKQVLFRVGVLHAIANRMAAKWAGVHKIRVQTVKPHERHVRLDPRADRALGSSDPIELFPIIRILPRHY